jgi:flavorubredoxin
MVMPAQDREMVIAEMRCAFTALMAFLYEQHVEGRVVRRDRLEIVITGSMGWSDAASTIIIDEMVKNGYLYAKSRTTEDGAPEILELTKVGVLLGRMAQEIMKRSQWEGLRES